MFDEILKTVKEQFSNNPEISALPPEKQDALYKEISNHISKTVAQPGVEASTASVAKESAGPATSQPASGGIGGSLLGKMGNAATSGSTVTGGIGGGLIGSLTSKLGLPASITTVISGALPGLLQKFAGKSMKKLV